MKKVLAVLAITALALSAGAALGDAKEGKIDGKTEFAAHCAACHKDGGNMVNPQKTLHRADREANGIKGAKDVVKLMRNPGPGMTKFDKNTMSDAEAKAIAEYVIKTW